ncbi:putative beta-galactosidase C [Bienertia sinuspersici]
MGCFSNCFGNKKRHQNVEDDPLRTMLLFFINWRHMNLLKKKQEGIEKAENQVELTPHDTKKKVTFAINVQVYEDLRTEFEEEEEGNFNWEEREYEPEIKEGKYVKASVGSECNSDSSSSSLFSFPRNHRYRNFRDSDDEYDELLSSDKVKLMIILMMMMMMME